MKRHILTVDDETEIREILGEVLIAHGYRVTPASSASEAQRVVENDAPHLIISDLQLEDADGLEMIRKLKTSLPDVPVILLTGVHFDPEVVRATLGQKISCYVEKTAPLQRLLEEVERLLGA